MTNDQIPMRLGSRISLVIGSLDIGHWVVIGAMRFGIATKAILPIAALIVFSLTLVGLYLERQQRAVVVAQVVARLEAEASLLSREVGAAVLQR